MCWRTCPGISLDAIFSPEHGVTGTLDTTDVKNAKDAATGVTVYSVYGASDAARRPPIDVLKRLDAVVIDLADAGARFYTYETTVGYFLEAAAKAGIEVVILDRPDPITGSFVQGPVSDEGRESFTNYFPEPVRHGMTMGELAKMFNAERHIGAQLDVVADARLAAGGLVRFDRPRVGESVAEFAEFDRGDALSGSGDDRGHECLGGTRDGYSVRSGGRALDQEQGTGGLLERSRDPECAVRARLFSRRRPVTSPGNGVKA